MSEGWREGPPPKVTFSGNGGDGEMEEVVLVERL